MEDPFNTSIFQGDSVTEISIKTGTEKHAESDCGAELEICDNKGKCCKTSFLDNKPGNDRESGQTNVYTKETILGLYAREVKKLISFYNFFHSALQGSLLSDPESANLTIFGNTKNREDGSPRETMNLLNFVEGWYVEWIKISLSSGRIFFCPVDKW